MRNTLSTFVVASVAVFVQPALATPPTGEQVMREMAAAFADAPSLRARVTFEGVGSIIADTPRGACTFEMAHADDATKLSLDGNLWRWPEGDQTPLRAAFDGEKLQALKPIDQVLAIGPLAEQDDLLPEKLSRVFRWAWRWDTFVGAPFGPGGEGYPADRLGETVLDGIRCDVVRVDYSEVSHVEELDIYWFVAQSDRLPRRIEATYYFGDGAGLGISRLSEMDVGAPVEADSFRIEAPGGYSVREFEPAQAAAQAEAPRPIGVPVGDPAPDFTLKDADGKEHTLSDYKGKVVLLDFWATWCGPCKAAMPGLQEVHKEFKNKGFVLFGVNCWDQPGAGVAYMKEQGFTYTTLLEGDPVAGAYRVSGIPTFYIVGKDGTIVHHEVGFHPGGAEGLKKIIAEQLGD